ncbi:hypothetical protein TrVE_jg1428 [Triparma verrucosa]|uniref:Cytochrome b5 heme-binding domain-containing protein n=1 Tax=Triparma verrucosa TaxID=1606542 RepID=A0A9W7F9T6_9STRA|nr:hypothetical protein TrVE_jg1428 [Triparma verrucosa]
METVDLANSNQLHSILDGLKRREFFRFFEVDLEEGCQFWKEDQDEEFECTGGGEDEEDSLSSAFSDPFSDPFAAPEDEPAPKLCTVEPAEPSFSFSPETDPVQPSSSPASSDCEDPASENFWVDVCKPLQGTSQVIDLLSNPEHNTYYNGSHIWEAIYNENCVQVVEGQCYEEKVLYRLLSGLHSSTSISVARNFYPPSKKKNRTKYEPNPTLFVETFNSHPDYLRNVHFSYVVLLRALRRGAPFLKQYNYVTGNSTDDFKTQALMNRLADSAILDDCASVFDAFDETLMFSDDAAGHALKKNFKGVFHNVSKIVDCVQCQQCRLHAKLSLLGYGAALKMLFLPEDKYEEAISRNEVVAFVGVLAKMSESITDIKVLGQMYWDQHEELLRVARSGKGKGGDETESSSASTSESSSGFDEVGAADGCIASIKKLAEDGRISPALEIQLVIQALKFDPALLLVCKHYSASDKQFLLLIEAVQIRTLSASSAQPAPEPDCIVVGTGLAGLSAALTVLDNGGTVTLVEKEARMGGNSAKASSGINACCPFNDTLGDSRELFKEDTTRSAGKQAQPDLIQVLVDGSEAAVAWLKDRVGVDLSKVAQLGGHSAKRTNRPNNGMAGAEIIYGMQREVKKYEKSGQLTVLLKTRMVELTKDEDSDRIVGIKVQTEGSDEVTQLTSRTTILATGGFASDRSQNSYLDQHRPELMAMPATAGDFSTGDGISAATALGAAVVDMDKVQLHPTGWVDPSDPDAGTKTLAAELMRGVGGLLLNSKGERFCNEVSTRSNVTHHMLLHNDKYAETGVWDKTSPIPDIWLVLSEEAGVEAGRHVELYSHKGLLTEVIGLKGVAKLMGSGASEKDLKKTFSSYAKAASGAAGEDEFGKRVFRNLPANVKSGKFFVGKVTPVLHYCMGGLKIDTEGNVLGEGGEVLDGLWAAGEVAGGVHGGNRLGGNSLLECTVYGRRVGGRVEVRGKGESSVVASGIGIGVGGVEQNDSFGVGGVGGVGVGEGGVGGASRKIVKEELGRHTEKEDCWIGIHGKVYDLTAFAEEHPPGPESIWELCGLDGTEVFKAVHSASMLEDFEEELVGLMD